MDDQTKLRYVKGKDGVLRGPYSKDDSNDRTIRTVLPPGLHSKWKKRIQSSGKEESDLLRDIVDRYLTTKEVN